MQKPDINLSLNERSKLKIKFLILKGYGNHIANSLNYLKSETDVRFATKLFSFKKNILNKNLKGDKF